MSARLRARRHGACGAAARGRSVRAARRTRRRFAPAAAALALSHAARTHAAPFAHAAAAPQERYTVVKQIGKGSYGAALLAKLKIDRCGSRARGWPGVSRTR